MRDRPYISIRGTRLSLTGQSVCPEAKWFLGTELSRPLLFEGERSRGKVWAQGNQYASIMVDPDVVVSSGYRFPLLQRRLSPSPNMWPPVLRQPVSSKKLVGPEYRLATA